MHTNIEIALNPLTDGFAENMACEDTINEDGHVLIIGTNGNMRLTDQEEARGILEKLLPCIGSFVVGISDYLAMFNENKAFDLEEGRFFVGSMVVMKMREGTLVPLSDEEIAEVRELLKGYMATLVNGDLQISALALG